jgi:DNA polymerase I-like protein with 3'-5' exonuclease and polymerase domains
MNIPVLAVDTETTGTDFYHGCRAFMITACDGTTNYWWTGQVNPYTREVYWDLDDLDEAWSIIDSAKTLVFQNAKFDVLALRYLGLPMETKWPVIHDTIIAAHAINAAHDTRDSREKKKPVGRSLGLKQMALEYLHYPTLDEDNLEEAVKRARNNAPQEYAIAREGHPFFPAQRNQKWYKMDYWMAMDECLQYGLGDVERTWLLWAAFKTSLLTDNLWAPYKKRLNLMRHCFDITDEGEDFNKEAATKYIKELQQQKEEKRELLKTRLGINWKLEPSKPTHVKMLIQAAGVPEDKLIYTTGEKSGKLTLSTNKEAMPVYKEHAKNDILDHFTEWKLLNTRETYITQYLNWVAPDGKIHGNLNPTGTRETRQSSDSPNIQNRTAALDRFYHPRKGWLWWDADFANIEMRIWGYAVGNQMLVDLFNTNGSYHMLVFNEVFPAEAYAYSLIKDKPNHELTESDLSLKKLYRNIKAMNFGIIYGATERKADETVGRVGSYRKLVNRIPEIEQFTRSLIDQVYSNLEKCGVPSIYTLGGYRLPVPLEEPFKACNYYVQGSAGVVTMDAMDAIKSDDDYIASGSRMYNQVHDSIRIKIPICNETDYLINHYTQLMEGAGRKYIPACDVTYNIITHPEEAWPF